MATDAGERQHSRMQNWPKIAQKCARTVAELFGALSAIALVVRLLVQLLTPYGGNTLHYLSAVPAVGFMIAAVCLLYLWWYRSDVFDTNWLPYLCVLALLGSLSGIVGTADVMSRQWAEEALGKALPEGLPEAAREALRGPFSESWPPWYGALMCFLAWTGAFLWALIMVKAFTHRQVKDRARLDELEQRKCSGADGDGIDRRGMGPTLDT